MRVVLFFFLISVSVYAPPVFAQDEPKEVVLRDLAEIVVLGRRLDAVSAETQQRIPLDEIAQTGGSAVADILRLVPAAHIQTNSRGETLVFLRNAGERQVAVFFDGALLNIPWDNRIDLSLVPASVIGGMTVAKGVTSVQYGANVVGGAINIISRTPDSGKNVTEFSARAGSENLADLSFLHMGEAGRVSYLAAGGYLSHDGIPVSDKADLAFNQTGEDRRTNTDQEQFNALLRLGVKAGDTVDLGLSFLIIDAEKGIAPEGHKDPDISNVRFWRYPEWRTVMGILSGDGRIAEATFWKSSVWLQSFEQTIDSFASSRFELIEDRQIDDNLTAGARALLGHEFGDDTLLFSLNGLFTSHKQRELEFTDGIAPSIGDAPRQTFSERLLSFGLEYEAAPVPGLTLTIGGSVDWFGTPKTGDKPGRDDFTAVNATLGATYRLSDSWRIRGAVGRKVRLPTLRELFGEAINRFLVNPDLSSEKVFLAEIGAAWQQGAASFEITPFLSITSDTIDQQNVTVDGNRLRQRINLRGSRILGLEATGSYQLTEEISLSGHLTASDNRRKPAFAGDFTRLSEKPDLLLRAQARYEHPSGFGSSLELLHTGRAFSLNDDDVFVPLNRSSRLNLRLSYRLDVLKGAEIYLRADNITDAVETPQLGLPGAGRWISGGIKAAF